WVTLLLPSRGDPLWWTPSSALRPLSLPADPRFPLFAERAGCRDAAEFNYVGMAHHLCFRSRDMGVITPRTESLENTPPRLLGDSRARAAGKHCGRPFIDTKLEGRIREALAAP